MNKLLKSVVALLASGVFAGAAANNISINHHIDASGPGSLGYTYFDVSQADTVSLVTTGTSIDAVLYLLRWDGHLDASDYIAYNDDSGKGGGGGWMNASISQFLQAGSYVAVIGDYALSLPDVLSGLGNTNNAMWGVKTGDVTLYLGAPNATIVDPDPRALVPEPGTVALIGLALVLVPVLRRRTGR